MAILTLKGHVSRALDFCKKDSLYFAIGKPTQWESSEVSDFDPNRDYDVYPPAPANTDDILDITGFKKTEFRSLVIPDNEGQLEYRGTKWKIVSEDDAFEKGARWIYLSTTLTYNELPTDKPYRQVGLMTGLEVKSTVDVNKYALTPDEVEDIGICEVLDNRKPVYRENDTREIIKIIMEF